jgi:hypothetical protein
MVFLVVDIIKPRHTHTQGINWVELIFTISIIMKMHDARNILSNQVLLIHTFK